MSSNIMESTISVSYKFFFDPGKLDEVSSYYLGKSLARLLSGIQIQIYKTLPGGNIVKKSLI